MRTLSELLGHSDVAFTMQVYGHSDAALKADAMTRIHNVGKASKG
jgi:integrase